MTKDICTRLLLSISNHATEVAIKDKNTSLTYAELAAAIGCLSHKMKETCQGSIEGKYVLVYASSPLEAIVSQITVIMNSGICVPLDHQIPLSSYNLELIENIACIVTDNNEAIDQINVPILPVSSIWDAEELLNHEIYPYVSHRYSEYTHYIMTPETAGASKPVLLSHESVINEIDAKMKLLNIDNQNKVCLSINLSLVASIWQIYSTLFVGGTLIV